MAKYDGADWLKGVFERNHNEILRRSKLSSLGEKVADVLGQVEKGIYHVHEEILAPKVVLQFFKGDKIRLPFYNGNDLSSFDSSRLTALFLCASAAGLEVEISGASWRYYALEFRFAGTSPASYFYGEKAYKQETFDEVDSACDRYCDKRLCETRSYRNNKFYVHGRYFGKLNHDLLYELLRNSHSSCIRVQLQGLSPKSLKILFHQRDREGDTYSRHPTWEEAVKTHEDLWKPLLEEDAIA